MRLQQAPGEAVVTRWRQRQGAAASQRRDRGVTTVEYGLIIAGVALVGIPALLFLRSSTDSAFDGSVTGVGISACAPGTSCTVTQGINTLPAKTIPAPIVPPTAPNAPVLTGATAGPGNGEVTLTWTAPTTGVAPTRYVATGTPAGTCDVDAPTLSCVLSGLTPGTLHSFTVKAYNITAASASSNALTATPTGSLPACQALALGTQYNMSNNNSRNVFTLAVVSNGTLTGATQGASTNGGALKNWNAAGDITFGTSGSGTPKTVSISFTYTATGCTGTGTGSITYTTAAS